MTLSAVPPTGSHDLSHVSGRRWRCDFQSGGLVAKVPAVVGQWERCSRTRTAGLEQSNIFSTLSVVPKKTNRETPKALGEKKE